MKTRQFVQGPERRKGDESFIAYWDACEREVAARYGITPADAYEAEDVAHAQEAGWTAQDFAQWLGDKYALTQLPSYQP